MFDNFVNIKRFITERKGDQKIFVDLTCLIAEKPSTIESQI